MSVIERDPAEHAHARRETIRIALERNGGQLEPWMRGTVPGETIRILWEAYWFGVPGPDWFPPDPKPQP